MAEETQVQQASTEQATAIDYNKIESMIAKGTQQKESAILKSYFEQQGLSAEEIQTAVQSYKANKAEESRKRETAYTDAQQQVAQLQAELQQMRMEQQAQTIAAELGVAPNAIPYALRMADFTDAVTDQGEISAEKVKSALEQVLKDVPALKSKAEQNSGFVPIGGSGESTDAATKQNEMLSKIFGSKRRKED